jgi:Zn-dependent M28 family amino/carboxypeptidase
MKYIFLLFTLIFSREIKAQCPITSEELKMHVSYLASDKMEGRYPGTAANTKVVNYISENFRQNGINPIKANYLQEFVAQLRRDSTKVKTWNVVGMIEGNDEYLKNEFIVLGAHYDHLGKLGEIIYNGADDNASGTAALLEISQKLGANRKFLKRSIIFIAFGAEEQGLLGSQYFTEHPLVPLEKIKLMVNIDMLGRLNNEKHVYIGGGGTFPEGESMLKRLGEQTQITPIVHAGSVAGSDHVSFYKKNISVLGIHTGGHEQYHTPNDKVGLIKFDGEQKAANYIFDIIMEIASTNKNMEFIKQD